MSWWDIVIVAFIGIAILEGYRKGLLLRLGGWVGGTLVFFIVAHQLQAIDAATSHFLDGRKMVGNWIRSYLNQRKDGATTTEDTSTLVANLPVPEEVQGKIMHALSDGSAQATASVYDHVARILAVPLWHVLLFVAVWAIAILILYALGHSTKRFLYYIPFFETFDRFSGAFISSCFSLLMVGAISLVAQAVTVESSAVSQAIESSFFLPFLKTILVFLFKGIQIFV